MPQDMPDKEGALQVRAETSPALTQAITPMQMLQIAVERNADLDMLTKLMDLQDRYEAREARKAYVTALTEFKADPPTLTKNRKAGFDTKGGGHTEYEYVNLAQVANVVAPALSACGLSHGWSTSQDNGISVTCTLTHRLGHSESVTMTAPADTTGSKNTIQAIGSTVSYLQRYTLLAITGLAASDQDSDGAHDGVVTLISDEQKKNLIDKIAEVRADAAKFWRHLGVDYVDMLPASKYQSAMQALVAKGASQ